MEKKMLKTKTSNVMIPRQEYELLEVSKLGIETGFYFQTPSKEYFFVTDQTKRTEKLCKAVEEYLIADGCRFVRNGAYHGAFGTFSIKEKLQAATCEVKHTEKFGDYYDIKGENFGGAGGFVKDGNTKIVLL